MLQQKQAAELDLSTEVATRLNLVDRETPAVTLTDTHTAHARHSDEDVPRLTKVRWSWEELHLTVIFIVNYSADYFLN